MLKPATMPEKPIRSKVFVVNDNGYHDLDPLSRHGELVIMSEGFSHLAPREFHRRFRNLLRNVTISDYIALVGSPLQCAIAYYEMMTALGGESQLLIYDKREGFKLHQVSMAQGEG